MKPDSIDIGVGFLVLILVLGLGYFRMLRRRSSDSTYRFFFKGLLIKMAGTVGFCLLYLFYFEGGDTFDYHQNGVALVNLFFNDFSAWTEVMLSSQPENYYYFNADTGYPNLRHFLDPETFNVSRILFFFELITFKSFIGASVLLSAICYLALFSLYQVFYQISKVDKAYLFYATTCVPSVLFWSGGMLKDTITLFCSIITVVLIYKILHDRVRLMRILGVLLALFTIIKVKPYLIVGMLPAVILWIMLRNIMAVRSAFIRVLLVPLVVFVFTIAGFAGWNAISGSLGDYSSVQGIIEKAAITQEDLQNQRYEGNSFDIGAFEPTVQGAFSKFPQATVAGLYRPFLFEANNLIMILSGLENLVLLLLSVIAIFRVGYISALLRNHPIFAYTLIFAVIFGFAIGLSTSNFGALVRFKIPMLPLLSPFLFLIYYRNKIGKIA